jgi:ABC-type transport system involved in cytochrome c biogenesis permease subunit
MVVLASAEVWRMMWDALVTVAVVAALVAYSASFVLFLFKRERPGWIAGALGWLANLTVFVLNWYHAGHPPFGNMYHVLVVLGLCFLPAYFVLSRRTEFAWLAPHFAVASCIPMIGVLFMARELSWSRVPALQSPWFVPHVFSYMLSYSLMTVAFVTTCSGMLVRDWGDDPEFFGRCRQASYAIARLAFPLLTFGMLSGALWAEEAWGIYWSWDPKETWSLVTWMLYLIYFHARFSPQTRKYETLAQVFAFAALITTFIFVNVLPKFGQGLHSYS